MALAPPAPILFSQRSRLVNALLIFGTIPFHEGKSGHKLVNIGRVQTKTISNNTKTASGSTYDCGSAAAMAPAPPAPIPFARRSRLVNALLIFGTIPFHEGKSGRKLVNIGRMQTKTISNSTLAASGCTYDCGNTSAIALAPPAPIWLLTRMRLVNALLTRMVNGQMCSTENKFVSIGRMQTKQNSHSS